MDWDLFHASCDNISMFMDVAVMVSFLTELIILTVTVRHFHNQKAWVVIVNACFAVYKAVLASRDMREYKAALYGETHKAEVPQGGPASFSSE